MEYDEGLLASIGKRAMLVRLLTNLKGAYLRSGQDELALAAVDRLLVLQPEDADEVRDRGLLLYRLRRYWPALGILESWLEQQPGARDRGVIEKHVTALRQLVASLN
jgi:regulator of sirC expression with transglutaminase-like and TPR domain